MKTYQKLIAIIFILTVLIIASVVKTHAQTSITAGVGKSIKGSVAELKIGHSINNHSVTVVGIAHLSSSQPEYLGLSYGYSFGIFQPYVGYGYQKQSSDHKDIQNTWKANYGLQVNFKPKENAPAGLYVNVGATGNEAMITGGINLKF